ncbi:hypothetical protein GWI33_016127 [Rhynchophorus ferrugineus]|uniref:Uncharacterized protein n=1 Tax=Rhynchophorus ferrugineus TaxID=354439 RepID=A0A834I1U2_RHYFE|nr:hypothetical protein GWI33_016127 [Rhynchophorus ferrugineus]
MTFVFLVHKKEIHFLLAGRSFTFPCGPNFLLQFGKVVFFFAVVVVLVLVAERPGKKMKELNKRERLRRNGSEYAEIQRGVNFANYGNELQKCFGINQVLFCVANPGNIYLLPFFPGRSGTSKGKGGRRRTGNFVLY